MDERTTTVMLAGHHIALDAWSIGLLVRELADDLARPGGLPATAPLQYADYAAWQRRTLDPQAIAVELDWWAQTLKGAPQLSVFAPDRMPDAPPSGTSLEFAWDAELSAGLRQLVREEGATVYMALLAACAALLRAHTGQGDLLLGSPMGVRERPEFETLVGPFVNLLVVRLDLADDPSFAELLRRARHALLEAHAHRQVPFEMLVERLKPVRTFNHSPLFQVAVVQHNATAQGDVSITGGGALHDLTWFVREVDGCFAGSLEYRSDLFSAAAIGRIASQLQTLLRAAVADRQRPISGLPLLTPAEREQLLRGFNATDMALDTAPFARQFERQAALTPQRIAVAFEGQTLDYASLNRRANQLARHLRSLGIGPGALVGVCMERSLDMLVALLAVHKSSGAYVPLDPGFPADRLAFMLEDSGARVLVTSGEAADAVQAPTGVRRIDPVAEVQALAAIDGHDLDPLGTDDDPAYVIYTSGSTGRPKGVTVPRGALANFLGSMRREPGLAPSDVLAAVTTISFDIAGLELYLPLIVGARIELVSRETANDGMALAEQLDTYGATVLQATPATWRLLLEAGWRPARPLRAFCGGEPLPRDLADTLLRHVQELWNLYGPTETTIWSTLERVGPSPEPVTIGKPIANTQVYVLDGRGEPLPIGLPGELWIGGAGVALGYHRRPELSAERFVADRFSARPGARLYRTGDLARWDAQGRLHHLGRLDHQVKIRGFRIELGEIEASLSAHPAVRQTVVMGREAGPADLRLVAYIVFHPGKDLTASDVRRHLRRELPDYMIPSVVAAVDVIPLTPNGKVDRAALPDPFKNAVQASKSYIAPAPGAEQTMAEIWREILQVERVGADDNFFELGGHSLLSLRVTNAVQKRLGWRMDARLLFFQTLRQVAASAALGKGSANA
jgi:amino acid adenylation domain-containing protein